jgi:glycosyltransferase involved in cell wall biosynthesis
VLVLQNWPNDAVMCAWRKCLFGVVPSIWADPCPIVVMEAMRASRPVIASRIGGLADQVVDGETGMLVPPNDVEALRHALERLLADGALRERMGEAAGRRAHQFLASTVVSRIESVYANVLSHKPTHPELAPLSS